MQTDLGLSGNITSNFDKDTNSYYKLLLLKKCMADRTKTDRTTRDFYTHAITRSISKHNSICALFVITFGKKHLEQTTLNEIPALISAFIETFKMFKEFSTTNNDQILTLTPFSKDTSNTVKPAFNTDYLYNLLKEKDEVKVKQLEKFCTEQLNNKLLDKPTLMQFETANFYVTPLVYAALHKNIKAVEYLLRAGADPNVLATRSSIVLWSKRYAEKEEEKKERNELFSLLLYNGIHNLNTSFVDEEMNIWQACLNVLSSMALVAVGGGSRRRYKSVNTTPKIKHNFVRG